MSSPILVTGATGNVGAPLVRLLAAAGEPVRAAARRPPAPSEGAQPVELDFLDPATWPAAFVGVERMFLVRPPQLGNVRRDLLPALEAARVAGLRHVVLLSVQGADRLRVVPHAALERWLRGSGLQWTFLRPSFFLSNLAAVHGRAISTRGEITVPAGDGRTAFVDEQDVAAVAAVVLQHPAEHAGRAWTPTGPEALTYAEVAAALTDVLGRPVRYTRPGLLTYVRHARRDLGMPLGMVAVTCGVYTTARLGLAAGLTDDVHAVTGRPPTSLRAYLERRRADFLARS